MYWEYSLIPRLLPMHAKEPGYKAILGAHPLLHPWDPIPVFMDCLYISSVDSNWPQLCGEQTALSKKNGGLRGHTTANFYLRRTTLCVHAHCSMLVLSYSSDFFLFLPRKVWGHMPLMIECCSPYQHPSPHPTTDINYYIENNVLSLRKFCELNGKRFMSTSTCWIIS